MLLSCASELHATSGFLPGVSYELNSWETTMSTTVRTSSMVWAKPEIETVAEGVHRLPLPLPMDALTAVNIYVLETPNGLVLIDGGWNVSEGREQLEVMLGELGFKMSDISEILVTHMHRDHYTLAAALQREFGCEVRLGAGEGPSMAIVQNDSTDTRAHFDILREAGAAPLIDSWIEWIESQPEKSDSWRTPNSWISDGELFERGSFTLRAISTPGHTRGHFIFIEEDLGLMFSGDHLLPTITPSVGFEPVRNPGALNAYMDSLRLMLELPDLRIMPSHGPVGMSSHERSLALISHHDVRLAETLEAVVDGQSGHDVASALTWTKREHRHSDLEPYNQALATMETEYHLELLQDRGLVLSELDADGVRRYWPVA